jgi:hypothetical protein
MFDPRVQYVNKVKNCFLGKVTYFFSCTKVKVLSSENIGKNYFFQFVHKLNVMIRLILMR